MFPWREDNWEGVLLQDNPREALHPGFSRKVHANLFARFGHLSVHLREGFVLFCNLVVVCGNLLAMRRESGLTG